MVQPYFEVTIMDLHERFRQQALSYCGAAEVLWKNDLPQNKFEKPHNHYLAPCLLCVGFGYELLCKSVLLKAGLTAKELSKKTFGHDIWHMWNKDELAKLRKQAQSYAVSCHQDFPDEARWINSPKAEEFPTHLKHLSKLHTSETNMALRYPEGKMSVPEPFLLFAVLDRLVQAEKNTTTGS